MGDRQREILHRRTRGLLSYTGSVAIITGMVIASPALAVVAFPHELGAAPAFLLPGGVLLLLGLALRRLGPAGEGEALGLAQGSAIVLLSWILAVAFAAVPFAWVGGLDLTDAVFESTSGWTTTGLTVVDVTRASPLLLLLRSELQLAGGAGLAILMLSALVGPPGIGVSAAEGRERQLVPAVDRSAVLVVRIYAVYALLAVVALRVAGMEWFDAVNHGFTVISTGGFSTRPESIGAWGSAAVETVTIPFMILGNLSFVTAWIALRGRWRDVASDGEVRVFVTLGSLGATLLWWSVAGEAGGWADGVRLSLFEAVTALTTTGFSTTGYQAWPPIAWCVLLTLMVVGGGTCSTAGGVKQYRVYVLYRYARHELGRRLAPRRALRDPTTHDGHHSRTLSEREVAQIGTFLFLHLTALGIGTLVLTAHHFGLRESLFETASALGTVGLSIGITAPDAPDGVLWTLTLGMLLGRLEYFAVLVGGAKLVEGAILLGRRHRRDAVSPRSGTHGAAARAGR